MGLAAVLNFEFTLQDLLKDYSAEVTSGDRMSIDAAIARMAPGSEVFIASPPSETDDRQVAAAARLKRAGLTPVPHLVARSIRDSTALDAFLSRLVNEAGVDRVLVLGGDRDSPAGEFSSSLDLLQSGLLGTHGIRKVAFSWYPEDHPRIAAVELTAARTAKLDFAAKAALEVTLVSQFCFEAAPIVAMARHIRAAGVTAPLKVGVAGPARRAALLKYAVLCGVGASIRTLRQSPAARAVLAADTPEQVLTDVARAQSVEPALGIRATHFFTFAALASTIDFVEQMRRHPTA